VCEVPFEELSSVAAHLPSLQHQLMRVIGQSGDRDHDHMEMLVRKQASERIGLLLHSLGERLAHIGQSGTDFRLPMSRQDIARFLGLAIETVSRGFARLQEDGVIATAGRRVEILDVAELDRMAHGQETTSASRGARAPR
jgi:CRP/FNR family transcriptional regulator